MKRENLLFILTIPAAVMLYIPLLLLYLEPAENLWLLHAALRYFLAVVCFAGGIALFVWSYKELAFQGGTPSPFAPPHELVKKGPYAYTRNPMLWGVWLVLSGEAVFFGSFYLFCWLAVIVVFSLLFVPYVEEPKLLKKYGEIYMEYRAEVNRWLPFVR